MEGYDILRRNGRFKHVDIERLWGGLCRGDVSQRRGWNGGGIARSRRTGEEEEVVVEKEVERGIREPDETGVGLFVLEKDDRRECQ